MSTYYDNREKPKIKKEITKEQFYPNTYPKELMYGMMSEFGSIVRNKQHSKSKNNSIRKAIKRGRLAGFLPFCSRHYYGIK